MGVIKKQGIINTVLVYTGTLIGFISLLFIQPVFLSKEELGLTRMILGFAAIMSILFSFGISAVTIRYLPKTFDHDHKHRGFFGFVLIYTTLSVIAGCIILFLSKNWIFRFYEDGSQQFVEHFHFVVLLTIINAYILGLNSYCIALLKTTFTTFLNDVLSKILFIVVIFLHFFGLLDLEQFLFAFCMTYGITFILLIVNIFFIDRPGFIPDSKYIRENIGYRPIIRYGIIITVTAMNSVGLKYLDTLFVGTISVGEAGIYSVAAFIGLMIEMPLNALERIANPAIAHAMASKNIDEIKSIYYLSARFLVVLGGWLFVMVVSNINDLLTILPEEYQGGTLVTIFIACGALINMATGINYPILVNSDKYIWGSAFNIFLIVITVIGNIILVPHLGMLGAAITAFAASSIYNFLKFIFIRTRFQLQPFDLKTVYIFILILALSAMGYFIQPAVNPFLVIAIKGIVISLVYFSIIIASRWVTDLYKYVPAALKNKFRFFNER